MFFNRDLWLHALALPSAVVQHLFYKEYSDSGSPFRLPPERCPHVRTLMAWPEETSNLNASELDLARQEVASIANAVAKYEPVWMYASRQNMAVATSQVSNNVTLVHVDVEQLWLRDTGPILVTSTSTNEVVGIDFNFNYLGGSSTRPAGGDRTSPYRLLTHHNSTRISASMSAEGGALEVDGEGTLLVPESSLLHSQRNGEISKAGMEDTFRELLGIRKTIWLEGVPGVDTTDYRIDRLARFGGGSTVLLSRPHKSVARSDARYKAYEQARSVLSTSTNANDDAFNIIEIEEAGPSSAMDDNPPDSGADAGWLANDEPQVVLDTISHITDEAGHYFEAQKDAATIPHAGEDPSQVQAAAMSYLSFYLVNGGVILPQFGQARTDRVAFDKIKELFPERTVEPVMMKWMPPASEGLHGATLQWPSTGEAC